MALSERGEEKNQMGNSRRAQCAQCVKAADAHRCCCPCVDWSREGRRRVDR